MKISENSVLDFAEGVKYRKEDFGILIVSKSTPALSLNHDGEFLWNHIDGKRSVSELIEITEKEYNKNAHAKVTELLQNFVDLGLCVIKGSELA